MLKNFEKIKRQLEELAPVINAFKSEAVQLRVAEYVLGGDVQREDKLDKIEALLKTMCAGDSHSPASPGPAGPVPFSAQLSRPQGPALLLSAGSPFELGFKLMTSGSSGPVSFTIAAALSSLGQPLAWPVSIMDSAGNVLPGRVLIAAPNMETPFSVRVYVPGNVFSGMSFDMAVTANGGGATAPARPIHLQLGSPTP